MSSRISMFSGSFVAALSTALILHTGSAMAAEPASRAESLSAQDAMQAVLTGHHPFHAAPGIRAADINAVKSSANVQESMQEVLLGESRLRIGLRATIRTAEPWKLASARHRAKHSPSDTQAAVQRMLRGDHSPAGPVAERSRLAAN